MKIILVCVGAMFIQGCSSPSDIDLVRNGIMEFNKTLTVGEAFGGWSQCKEKLWSERKVDNGQRVVRFTCDARNVSETSEILKELYASDSASPGMDKALSLESVRTIFEWTINKDETFQLSKGVSTWEWKDGTKRETESADMVLSVYENKELFPPKEAIDEVRVALSKGARLDRQVVMGIESMMQLVFGVYTGALR